MAYGEIKVDTVTFTDGGIDKSVSISGLVQNPTFSGNITVTGTISGNTVQGQTVSGVTVTGTTANFVSGVFTTQISGATITGNVGSFTTITGGTVTLTSGVFASGTAAAPSVSIGTTDNGLYSPGADQVAISTGGSARLTITSDGDIRTTWGNDRFLGSYFNSSYYQGLIFDGGTSKNLKIVNRSGDTSADIVFLNAINGTPTEKLRITSAGLVGIGTSDPAGDSASGAENLVIGNASSSLAGITINTGTGSYQGRINFGRGSTSQEYGYILCDHSNAKMQFGLGSSTKVTLDSSGRLGIGTTSPTYLCNVIAAAGSQNIFQAGQTGVSNGYTITSNGTNLTHAWFNGGSEAARIDSSGRLGIGTSSVSAPLHVSTTGAGIQDVQWLRNSQSVAADVGAALAFTGTPTDYGLARISGAFAGSAITDGGYMALSTRAVTTGVLTERMRITAAGAVGIGTTAPSQTLGVAGGVGIGNQLSTGTTGSIKLTSSGGTNYIQSGQNTSNASAAPLVFTDYNAFNEWARINSNGRLGIGTSSPAAKVDVWPASSDAAFRGNSGISAQVPAFEFRGYNTDSTNGGLDIRTNLNGTFTDRVRITNDGLVGIGTTAPLRALQIGAHGSGNGEMALASSTTGNCSILMGDGATGSDFYRGYIQYQNTNDALVFATAATQRMAIDSSGRLLIGTSTARANFFNSTLSANFQVEGTSHNSSNICVVRNSNDTSGAIIVIGKSRGTTANSNTVVSSGDGIGQISYQATDGSEMVEAASIACQVDGTPGANDMPGRLVFSTTEDGASSPTARMKITSDGSFVHHGNVFYATSPVTTSTFPVFAVYTGGSTLGSFGTVKCRIHGDGDVENVNNSYGAISDIKLKENISDANSQWDDLKALQVRKYNFKEETSYSTHTQIGLVAQEAELVSPGLVGESPDRDEDGNDLGTVTKSVNYSVLYMKAVKALQEAMERIETLEQRLNDAGIN